MIITFLYRIDEKMYHGKYIGYMPVDYEEGLDIEVLNKCFPIWKQVYTLKDPSNVYVAVTSHQRDGLDYFQKMRNTSLTHCIIIGRISPWRYLFTESYGKNLTI